MNEQSGAIGDLITLVAGNQQAEATPILNDLLGARIMDALQTHKQEIAQTLFAPGAAGLSEGTHDDEVEDAKLVKKLVKRECLAKEESEQLDEISKATAFRVGEKRYKKGSATHAASVRSEDPLTKKVLGNQAVKLFTKSTKAFEYAKKKEK